VSDSLSTSYASPNGRDAVVIIIVIIIQGEEKFWFHVGGIIAQSYSRPKMIFKIGNCSIKPCEGYICGKIMDTNKDFVWTIYLATAKPSQG
jgi:hypothetical protein